ncbi:MAG: diadenylate cyclase CdaA [Anaerolineae bacterium]|nr:diadenylate cyclase CdaA [Anaerolineae bacterium]MCO5188293.1 diadenylate cyclase CdaA [Anaerolineae bacterium]MCO5195259.1 diadenylate cyclase CdaA [Anaerolineae bacterium]MCO5198541.1 diadenylate cyclase CdaA [Anaerolineae bacterium]MCO5203485.1 diadenylate cyclase CdaA [Anaerolineae bacterium]
MEQIQVQIAYYLERINELGVWLTVIDILAVTLLIFVALVLVRGTRAVPVLRGLIVLTLLFIVFDTFVQLPALKWLLRTIYPALLVAIPVIFQPELRRALEQLGRAGGFFRWFRREDDNLPLIKAISDASRRLSNLRHGALIVIERETGIQEYIDTGVTIDATPSADLLITIFNKETVLHDGAVIVKDGRIAAAGCIMPLSTSLLSDRKMGLRHRAALGTSEVSDAVCVLVSEESGQIAIAHNGRILRRQDPSRLESILGTFLQVESRPAVPKQAVSDA